jgi:hypothetical protein
MSKYMAVLAGGLGAVLSLAPAPAGEATAVKEALQALNEYIGGWKGSGTSEQNRSEIWKESARWGWRFKGKDAWLTLELQNDKQFKGGELRYLPDRGRYEFTATDRDGKALVFEGELKKGKLSLTRLDPGRRETQQIQVNTAGGGDRLVINYAVKPPNRTLFTSQYQVAMTREGVSFASAGKKNECVVTGGLGTMAVSYKGMTNYVCCSGCRDAFYETPEKFIKEYQARKKGGN